jgi:hypothetical protein
MPGLKPIEMKKIFTLSVFSLSMLVSSAQVFWTENFGTGCSQGTVANTYTGTNGAWTIGSTGTNDPYANQWFVAATEAGMGVNNCGDGCLNNTQLSNRTLHVGNVAIPALGLPADQGAGYNSGGICSFGYCVITNRRAESPLMNCTNKTNITLAFNYMENGSGTTDNATLVYSADGGTTWSLLFDLAKTPTTCNPQGKWTAYSVVLPASANNNANVKIGFSWTNNDDGVGTDPSFAVDDITLSVSTSNVQEIVGSGVNIYSSGSAIIIRSDLAYKVLTVTNLLGSSVKYTQQGNSVILDNRSTTSGIYFIQVESNGQVITKKLFIQ